MLLEPLGVDLLSVLGFHNNTFGANTLALELIWDKRPSGALIDMGAERVDNDTLPRLAGERARRALSVTGRCQEHGGHKRRGTRCIESLQLSP